jgi:hypothetical protein
MLSGAASFYCWREALGNNSSLKIFGFIRFDPSGATIFY